MYFRGAAPAALTFLSVALSLQKVGHPWSSTIKKVMQPTEFCAPIVVMYQRNSATHVRLTTDFRHLNKYIKPEPTQIPTIDEIAARVQSATVFSTLDMTDSFFQILAAEESQHLLSFATPFGTYKYVRLPQGLKTSPKIFQRVMCSVLEGIPKATPTLTTA